MRRDHIEVCICTFKRASMLEELLVALSQQDTKGMFSFSVRVVDNDREESARAVVERVAADRGLAIEYVVEPRQNISRARNRAVANLQADYVAMIDDDERPEGEWLPLLWKTIQELGADGVLGPVLPYFPKSSPAWLRKSRLCERPSHPTGQWLLYHETRTGNALLRSTLFCDEEEPFKPEFGEGGGEDIDFFRRKMDEGKRFAWCNEAPVYERVPPERWELQYYCRRQFRLGGLRSERIKNSGELRLSCLLQCIARLVYHGLRTTAGLPRGRYRYSKPLAQFCYHGGYLVAACGLPRPQQRDELVQAQERPAP